MSPPRRRHRGHGRDRAATPEPTGVGEGSAAQRYAAYKAEAQAASSLRARWVSTLSFSPDPFQIQALDAVEAGSSVLVAAPTGAGKTIVGQFGAYVALEQGMRAFYTTPIKALSNQKYLELCDLFGAANVGLATGDTSVNSGAPVVVMTTEVARNMIYAGAPLRDLGVVILDEVHYLADKMRGPVWEEVIIHLPAHVAIIALSATVSNAEEFGAWIREVRSTCEIIVSEKRPVPLYQHMIVGEDIFDLYAPTGKGKLNPELVAATRDFGMRGGRGSRSWNREVRVRRESRPSTLISLDRGRLLPAITFIFSRAGCEDAVRQILSTRITLTTRSEAAEIESYVDEVIALLPPEDAIILGAEAWKRGLMRGIAAHHAGMLPLMKESVEHLFSRGLVKMVYATETLALGINMPARTVVIESLTKWNGSAHVSLSAGEYTQLSGRAGRRGIDTEGHAVVSHRGGVAPEEVAALASKRTYPLISAFTPTYNMVVNLLARSTRAQTRKVLESSFAQYQADSAVVALASRLTELEAQRDATAEDLSCSHGDVREYLTLRDQLGQTEKSGARARKREARDESRRILSGVRPGDVLALTRGRKTRLCVVGAKATSASGRVEVSVIGEDATWRALAPEDVRGAIAVVGHMSIPGGSALRRTKERTRIAGELRSGAAKGIYVVPAESTQAFDPISALRVAMRQHPVHRCPHREEHARAGAQWARLEREINRLRSSIDSQTGSVAAQFDRVCAVLERLGFLAGDEVTDAGQRLRRIFGERDLVIAMSLDEGAWDGLDECELASMVSALVYDSRSEDDAQELAPSGVGTRLRTAWEECMGTLERVHRAEKRYGCDPTPGLDGALMAATLAWAHGSTLATAIEGAPIQPGDFVRWMRQVMDCLGQIASASDSSNLARRAEGAKERIGRGIVAWSTI
ncbi:DEAD/DEAH box helicase [Actinomyces sp. oral taxon 180]|uniref:DEAD/DEAH box helicase n=1 Tax=Actinomyces sp. oral taxon 180 TaxID=651609 RepID=UPI0001F14B5C|nr:DEAD/DEAH box helicase [Actinomyces sp. oral taxon 180]EFU61949.1 helicase [Actinomyces sp. oral taxon 180 str. F0310]